MKLGDSDYEAKKAREIDWHLHDHAENEKGGFVGWLVHHPLIFNRERNAFNYGFPKEQMAAVLRERLRHQKGERLLIAPCGSGGDYKFLKNTSHSTYGIDLASVAVEQCPPEMEVKVGDILESGYPDATFDAIASPLFFHHLLRVGFDPFLEEFYRILRPGGQLVILEPCSGIRSISSQGQ